MKEIKNRYYIEFDNIEIEMSIRTQISKEQFDANLKFLDTQVCFTKDEEYQLERIETTTYEYREFIETRHRYIVGTATTRLIHQKCKKGFRFKNKGE